MRESGLSWSNAHFFGQDYARTCAEWRERFERAWRDSQLPAAFDETFQRIWSYYLAYCEGGFRAGSIDVAQVTLSKPVGAIA